MKTIAHSPRVYTTLRSISNIPLFSNLDSAAAGSRLRPARQQLQQIMAASTLSKEPRTSLSTVDDYRIVSNIDASKVPEQLKKDCILFYTPDTEPLARKIAEQGDHVMLGNIRWK